MTLLWSDTNQSSRPSSLCRDYSFQLDFFHEGNPRSSPETISSFSCPIEAVAVGYQAISECTGLTDLKVQLQPHCCSSLSVRLGAFIHCQFRLCDDLSWVLEGTNEATPLICTNASHIGSRGAAEAIHGGNQWLPL